MPVEVRMRQVWALGITLAACTPEHELEPWHGDDDGSALLFERPEEAVPERARLFDPQEVGTARLTLGGPPLEGTAIEGVDEELVVVDAGEDVRITWTDRRVQLLLWVERGALDDVIAVPTTGQALQASGDGQVQWPAGLSVTVTEAHGERVRIERELEAMRVTSWVPAIDVDQVWIDAPQPRSYQVESLRLHGAILDGPRGEVLAEPLDLDEGVLVARRDPDVGAYTPVAWSDGEVTVTGWAFVDDVVQLGGFVGHGTSGGCGMSSWCGGWASPTNLPANSPLRASPDGPVVGRTLRDLWVAFDDAGWGGVGAITPWGEAELWAEVPDAP